MSATEPRWYTFRDAVRRGQYGEAQRQLAREPELLGLRNGIGETVLHFLAVENDGAGVAWLHAKGADINAKNKFGTPVLFEVATLRYQPLFAWFAANGANLKAVDQYGQSLIEHLQELGRTTMIAFVKKFGV